VLGCLGTLALVLLVGTLSVWAYFRVRHQQALRAVEAEVKRIQAAGEPITMEDMIAYHRVPDGVFDATQLWLDALTSACRKMSDEEWRLPIVGSGQEENLRPNAPNSQFLPAQQFLAAHAETIEKTRKAAVAGGQCRYPTDFREWGAGLDRSQEVRNLARLLSLRLSVATNQGDVATALETLDLERALAATLDHDPTLSGQLVRGAVILLVHANALEIASALPLSDTQLADLQKQLAAIDMREPTKQGLIGGRAEIFHLFHHLAQLKEFEKLAGRDGTLQRPGDCRVFLELMRDLIEAADGPPAELWFKAKEMEAKLEEQVEASNPLMGKEVAVSAELFPAVAQCPGVGIHYQCIHDSTMAGLALRRYQLKHGHPPDSLSALVPEFLAAVPLDPFAGGNQPLKFVVQGNQFAIYSIGFNAKDEKALLFDPHSMDDRGIVGPLVVPAKGGESTSPAGNKE
jgi:hypothetical protein